MKNDNIYFGVSLLLLLLPIGLITWKLSQGYLRIDRLLPSSVFHVNFKFAIDSSATEEALFVKAFIPESNLHQHIYQSAVGSEQLNFTTEKIDPIGKKGEWRGTAQIRQNLSYSFSFQGHPVRFTLNDELILGQPLPADVLSFLQASEYIQSDHLAIQRLADQLKGGTKQLSTIVNNYFQYVYNIPASKTSELTDAIRALTNQSASCNGKSRLLVALCRATGIPARVVGGIILTQEEKRTSHLWTEIWMGDQWVPFDPLNGHFAYLPANFLELYRGDHFLITHTPDIDFDYSFSIQKENYYEPFQAGYLTLWPLVAAGNFSVSWLKVLLLLPLCGLIVGIVRNVVGLKSIGVFLPAIIAVSLDGIGLTLGILSFLVVVIIVSLLHFPMEKWGILHTPKLIIMLTAVVICLLGLGILGHVTNINGLINLLFFPIIILTIAAEKFAKTIIETGFIDALKLMGQTLLLTLICYLVFEPDFVAGFFLTFPETYLLIIAVLLLLGRWIGLRLSEYIRFGTLFNAK